MATSRAKKEEVFKELQDKFAKAVTIIFVKNTGVTVSDLTDLRKKLREGDTEIKIAKKTIVKKVAAEQKMPEFPEGILEGPIMTVMSYQDPIFGAKTLKSFMKENEKVEFAGALFEGEVFDKKGIERIASLPSKEELISMLLGRIQAPLYGLHHALSYHLKGLVVALSAIQKKKQEQAA